MIFLDEAYTMAMKRSLTMALLAALLPAVACAQRGGSHGGSAGGTRGGFSGFSGRGGFSSQGSSAFRGGTMPSARYGYPAGRALASRPIIAAARPSFYSARSVRPVTLGTNRYGLRSPARRIAGYPYGFVTWIDSGYLNYPIWADDDGNYDASQPADIAETYIAPPEVSEEPQQPGQQAAPVPEDAVTLIFKDGRPPQQIHNYALTRTMLYVRDQHHRDIPVSELDLAATEKVNRDAGVDFQLPEAAR